MQISCRRLCRHCRRRIPPEAGRPALWEPTGCPSCTRGFDGEFVLYWMLKVDDRVRQAIRRRAASEEIRRAAGCPTLAELTRPVIEAGDVAGSTFWDYGPP